MNSNLTIKIVDLNNELIGYTYPKRAKGLTKKGRAKYIDDDCICLLDTEVKLVEKKGLQKIEIPKYTLGEELLSAISHGFGTLLSIAALVLCVVFSSIHKDAYAVISSAIYGSMSIILYTCSTLYHSFKVNNAKRVFRIIDHCSIYLLIAGTYTPYTLVALRSYNVALGWTIFGIIWGCAILGITLNAINLKKFKVFSMILYIVMGWLIIGTFKILMKVVLLPGILMMLTAGVLYTVGAIFYGIGKKKKYMHGVFHLFVVAASVLFFFSIFLYVI